MTARERKSPIISLIVAVAENGVIGRGGQIPWRVSSDMKFFRTTTMGKPVIMGRKTWESLKKPLAGRDNIIVTRDGGYVADGGHVADTIEAAIQFGQAFATRRGTGEIMVIGGAQIYTAFMERADRLYLTRIHCSLQGDVYFPDPDPAIWREVSRSAHQPGEKDTAPYTFLRYERHETSEDGR